MRRMLAILVPLALLLLAGCGGGSSSGKSAQTHSVRAVAKAFYDAGLPFGSLVTGNRYVTGQVPFLPLKLNGSDLRFDVDAQLSGSSNATHSTEIVWVFDTDAHAQEALNEVPLKEWGQGSVTITRAHLANVIVIAANFAGPEKAKLDKALAALR